MVIPHAQLSPEALRGIVEEFVTRDGTEYGATETSLAEKACQVLAQIHSGGAVIVYDAENGSCHIVSAESYRDTDP